MTKSKYGHILLAILMAFIVYCGCAKKELPPPGVSSEPFYNIDMVSKELADVCGFIPSLLLPIYCAGYLAFYLRLYRELELERENIRMIVATKWQDKYNNFYQIIQNIPFEYIKVLCKPGTSDNYSYRLLQSVYVLLSIVIIILSRFIHVLQKDHGFPYGVYILLVMIYSMVTTAVYTRSYNEWLFYNRLDKIRRNPIYKL